VQFRGLGLLTNHPFDLAYQAAEAFTAALLKRARAAGFMRALLLQRICSSFVSGQLTALKMLDRELPEDEEQAELVQEALSALTPQEARHLRTIVEELSRPEARDPKLDAVLHFLKAHRTEGKTWLEHGCIIFSQYYETTYGLGAELAKKLPGELIAVYAGTGKSGIFRSGEFAAVEREEVKRAVKQRVLRVLVATDAACEGLNLQTLGTLINVDLPWNPSRLEQRLGRIKRFGQSRQTVDILNLVYHETQDEQVYRALSRRMKDRYDLFGGGLPDTIEDDLPSWASRPPGPASGHRGNQDRPGVGVVEPLTLPAPGEPNRVTAPAAALGRQHRGRPGADPAGLRPDTRPAAHLRFAFALTPGRNTPATSTGRRGRPCRGRRGAAG
jgi:hypothetical protein